MGSMVPLLSNRKRNARDQSRRMQVTFFQQTMALDKKSNVLDGVTSSPWVHLSNMQNRHPEIMLAK